MIGSQPALLVINLNERESECANCGARLVDPLHGLPMYEGEVVAIDDELDDWGDFDACRACYDLHAAGDMEALAGRALLGRGCKPTADTSG